MAMNIRKMLIPALLALSLIGNLAWLCISVAPKEEKPIIGTYCSEDASSYAAADHGEYLVFTKDGTYTRYRQLEVLERGPIAWKNPYSSWRKPPDTLTEKTRSSCLTDRRPLPIPALAMSRPISMCREKIDKKG